MVQIHAGRWTHRHDSEIVVFLIGMRVNQWHRVRAWWPTFAAMRPMLLELSADPSTGLLGHRWALGAGGPILVQYWASSEQLFAYANHGQHRAAWQAFNARVRKAGSAVGIWHETYVVPVGNHESVYSGMPLQGLAKATAHTPVGPRSDTAVQRLARGA